MYIQDVVLPLEQRGSSSLTGTEILRKQLPELFKKYNINSMFDAGANDAAWQAVSLANTILYSAGDRNPSMVKIAKTAHPHLNIIIHDITVDPLPQVDLLFVRDVAIHLNNQSKRDMINNWKSSNIPWLLTTQLNYAKQNLDFEYDYRTLQFAEINWRLAPWNWPDPIASVVDTVPELPGNDRVMGLWHRDQIC